MMRDNLTTKALIAALDAGYKVDDDGVVTSPSGKILSTWLDTRGYFRFTFASKELGNRKILVHQLAALQRFGKVVLNEGIEVRHLNNDSTDNSQNNIAFGTRAENEMDKDPETRKKVAKIAASKRRKLTKNQLEALRKDRSSGMNYKQLSQKYGIQKSTISYILNGATYRNE
jgi:hypothetical protein